MTVIDITPNRLSEILEPAMFSAYSVVGWLLFRVFGPEECEPKVEANRGMGLLQTKLDKPEGLRT